MMSTSQFTLTYEAEHFREIYEYWQPFRLFSITHAFSLACICIGICVVVAMASGPNENTRSGVYIISGVVMLYHATKIVAAWLEVRKNRLALASYLSTIESYSTHQLTISEGHIVYTRDNESHSYCFADLLALKTEKLIMFYRKSTGKSILNGSDPQSIQSHIALLIPIKSFAAGDYEHFLTSLPDIFEKSQPTFTT